MSKRIISLVLVLCMVLSIAPISALAATEEELYLQMLDLGLVDADGALIENNTFTTEDGTHLASLDELVDWLLSLDESEFDTIVTVDATGKSATASQMAGALAIEYDVNLLADQLRSVARGSATGADASIHNAYLEFDVTQNLNADDKATATVWLRNKTDPLGSYLKAPYDITIQVGLFALFLPNTGTGTVATVGNDKVGINRFNNVTFPKDSYSVSFDIDLKAIRDNYLKEEENGNVLDGNCYIMLQARTSPYGSAGMPDSSDYVVFSIAPSSTRSQVLDTVTKDIVTGMTPTNSQNTTYIGFMKALATSVSTETVDNTKYFAIKDVPTLQDGHSAKGTSPWIDDFNTALSYGIGDKNPTLTVKDVSLLVGTDFDRTSSSTVNPKLYYKNSDNKMVVMSKGFELWEKQEVYVTGRYDRAVRLARVRQFRLPDDTSLDEDSNLISVRQNIESGNWNLIWFPTVEVPFSGDATQCTPATWYLNQNWDPNVTDGNKPTYIFISDTFTLADSTKPTLEALYTDCPITDFYPGNVIPITVVFSEPVYGDFTLVLKDGDGVVEVENCNEAECQGKQDSMCESRYSRSGADCSSTRTFYYTVRSTDGTEDGSWLQVLGVGWGSGCKDVKGNTFETTLDNSVGASYQAFPEGVETELLRSYDGSGEIYGGRYKDSIESITAANVLMDPDDQYSGNHPCKATVTVNLDRDLVFQSLWSEWYNTDESERIPVVISVDGEEVFDVEVKEDLNRGIIYLYSELELDPVDTDTEHIVELYIDGELYYGAYGTFTQPALVKATTGAYDIGVDSWPSGTENVVFVQDAATPVFYTINKFTNFSFDDEDQLYWKLTDENNVMNLTVQTGEGNTITVGGEDTYYDLTNQRLSFTTNTKNLPEGGCKVSLVLMATNGSPDDITMHTEASPTLEITIKDSGTPALTFPVNANTFYARQESDLKVSFNSNLAKHDPASTDSSGKIIVELFEATDTARANNLIPNFTLDRDAESLVIPGQYLKNISKGDEPSYILQLSSTASVEGVDRNLSTEANIVVRAHPAKITLTGLDNPIFVSGKKIDIGWTVSNFDLENNPTTCAFEFSITKGSENITTITDVGTKIAEQTYSGGFSFTPETPNGLKDNYIVTVKAKNASDPTWSSESSTVTIYKANAMKITVDGEAATELTLKNHVAETTTTTSPTINQVSGLTNARAIAELRSELGLIKSVSINSREYMWSRLDDRVKWTTSTGSDQASDIVDIVTINYLNGMVYSDIRNLSATAYLPQALMVLCGLSNGTETITAQHEHVDELNATLEVSVERLKDKLYLFQFTPAVETTISYVDGLGATHVLTSNSDGSLALFEPNGIKSDLSTSSIANGEHYRGTIFNSSLKSGEGNGTKNELYPLNALELRKAAVAEIQLLKPDGTPLTNTNVTLRGGVYRNRISVAERDDAYCSVARFAKAKNDPANLDGTVDQTFTTDSNGMLSVYMDVSQFVTNAESHAVGVGDKLEFIFEVRFDGYQPELITVDGSLSELDNMRSGENIVTLIKSDTPRPFVAEQTVDYNTGRDISVRTHTGVIGPSSNYPQVQLKSTVMLWGANATLDNSDYSLSLRTQENAYVLSEQDSTPPEFASYPFSSIPLVSNTMLFTSDSFVGLAASKRTPLELALYQDDTKLYSTITLPFGAADLTTIEKVEDAPSVISLMVNLALYGSVSGANTANEMHNNVSDAIVNKGLSFLEDIASQTGRLRAVLQPTEDPTRYQACIWIGKDNADLAELDYDQNGLYVEPMIFYQDNEHMLGKINDKYTLADFQAMADGSYFTKEKIAETFLGGGSTTLEGWMSAEIRYDFDKGEWDILTTGGGFTAGKSIDLKKYFEIKKIFVVGFNIKGGVLIDLNTAVRYAQQLGYEWNDETAKSVNDYLTTLRINAYLGLFAGLGSEKMFKASIGVFGGINLDNEDRFLTRKYLKNEKDRDMRGQFLQLGGDVGVRVRLGAALLYTEWDICSVTFRGEPWTYNSWDEIDNYWKNATSGLGSTGWLYQSIQGNGIYPVTSGSGIAMHSSGVTLEPRDYLDQNLRVWLGGDSGIATLSLDSESKLAGIQTNAYLFSSPNISDDGSILVYLSDADSTDVSDVEVRYSLTSGGGFPDGTAIPSGSDGFDGYGDSSLDFDGNADFAGAVWLREAADLGLKPEVELTEAQQTILLNGLEVVASIWNGEEWTTTRLTSNGSQEFGPVIASNNNGQAIVAWHSVQTGETPYEFTDDRILCKIYNDGEWSEDTYTLYNGSNGESSTMNVEMLDDGTAAIAFSVTDTDGQSDIYYTVLDVNSTNIEDDARTIRATTNTWTDISPQLTAVGDNFVLGWHSIQELENEDLQDVGLLVFDSTGAPIEEFPVSLSDLVNVASFNGQFTFVKGAESLDTLSILWNDARSGSENNDVIRAVKFSNFGTEAEPRYGASAAIEMAELPANTNLDHMDAYVCTSDGLSVQAMLQGTTSSTTEFETISFEYELDGETYSLTSEFPLQTVNLYSATATYTDEVAVVSTMVDYSTLTTNAIVPAVFEISNQGMSIIDSVTVAIGGDIQTFTGLDLMPNQTTTLSVVVRTGDTIRDMDYTVTASFSQGHGQRTTSGTLYLDYPDVGISTLTVTKEQDGVRALVANMYNQSASLLSDGNRRVVLGVYTDPNRSDPVDGKYFQGGTSGEPYEITLTGGVLASLDSTGYSQEFVFDIDQYVKDSGVNHDETSSNDIVEIPDGGVMLFFDARIQEYRDGEWTELPEPDSTNNQKYINFESLLERSDNIPVTKTVEMNNSSTTTAYVQIRNHSLLPNDSGYLVAALVDDDGRLLETLHIGDLNLDCEEIKDIELNFTELGSNVILHYGEPVSSDGTSANADSITIEGLPLNMDSFDENDKTTLEDVEPGNYLLTVIPEDPNATISVNGEELENGMMNIPMGTENQVLFITITSADGSNTRTYIVVLKAVPVPTDKFQQTYCNLTFETNGGSEIDDLRRVYNSTIDLSEYVPTRDGYVFMGWYSDSALTNKVTFVRLTKDTTVYARWELKGATNPFTDVKSTDWFYEDVMYAYENGLMNGTSATTFSPYVDTTRGMIVTILYRLEGEPMVSGACPFTDVKSGSYYEKAIIWAAENGIVSGYGNGTFGPDDNITREQMAAILYRYAKYRNVDVSVGEATNILSYDDAFSISEYAIPALQWACGTGLINGTSASTLSPQGIANRAQIAAILHRFCKNILK